MSKTPSSLAIMNIDGQDGDQHPAVSLRSIGGLANNGPVYTRELRFSKVTKQSN